MLRKSAFTLLELLIVIAIIALLAAILFPVFGRARENARRSACMSNLKQVGLAAMQYVQDYDERMPLGDGDTNDVSYNFNDSNATGWKRNFFWLLTPYLKSRQVWVCPSAVADTNAAQVPTALSDTNYLANGIALGLFTGSIYSSATPRSLASISNTSAIVLLQENRTRRNSTSYRPVGSTSTNQSYWHAFYGTEVYNSLHFEGGNLLFCDGHAKWRKYDSLYSGEFGLNPNEPYSIKNGGMYGGGSGVNGTGSYTNAF